MELLQDDITELYYGITLQNYLYYRIVSQNHITESYYGITLRNHYYEEDPPKIPGRPWYPLGTPWHFHGPQKQTISQQLYSARSSRWRHLNPFVPPFCHVYYGNGASFGQPQCRPRGAKGTLAAGTGMSKEVLPAKALGLPLVYIFYFLF